MTKAQKLKLTRLLIEANRATGRDTYAGLSSDEIGTYNRALMFGDDDEAFPEPEDWKRITD